MLNQQSLQSLPSVLDTLVDIHSLLLAIEMELIRVMHSGQPGAMFASARIPALRSCIPPLGVPGLPP